MRKDQLFVKQGGGGVDQLNADTDRNFYLKELAGEECQCGREKDRGKVFCFGCYKRLPEEMKHALYRKLGNGYEEARELAAVYLGD